MGPLVERERETNRDRDREKDTLKLGIWVVGWIEEMLSAFCYGE